MTTPRKSGRQLTPLPQVNGQPALEAVLFDAGLTLIRATTPAAAVAAEALAGQGVAADPKELQRAMELAEQQIRSHWLEEDWWASEAMVRQLFESAYWVGLRAVKAVGEDTALARHLARAIYDTYHAARHWGLFPDVLPTLEALSQAGVLMGVVSDWGQGLEAIILELELSDYLAFLAVSAHLGISKPDPTFFRMALERIGVAPGAAIYVGDTYVKDVLGARAAGLAPVLLDRSGRPPPLDCATVSTLTDLLPLVGMTNGTAATS